LHSGPPVRPPGAETRHADPVSTKPPGPAKPANAHAGPAELAGAWAAAEKPGPVYATIAGGYVHVRFGRGFTAGDVEIVKRIRGRKWQPETRTWQLPGSEPVLQSLQRGFGDRLRLDGRDPPPVAGSPVHPTARARASHGAGTAAGPRPAARGDATAADGAGNVGEDAQVAELRRVVRLREYSRKTEKAYVSWVQRYFRWAGEAAAAPAVGATQDESAMVAFLEHLGHEGLAARSRNQAASALNFLLREVLKRDDVALPRARGPVRMPLVLTHREVVSLLGELSGKYQLIGMLLYSSGLRIGECMSLRLKDIDFELRQILVRDGKGRKDRYVPLAGRAFDTLRAHMRWVLDQHRRDRAAGHGWAPLPGALHRKDPGAGYEPGWQFLFPASSINADPATGRTGRWSLHVTAAERAFKAAVRRAGITKRATCHTLRHSFATETLRSGCDIRTLQQVMGHRDIRTTTLYLHVVQQTGLHIRSPLDRPDEYEHDHGREILPALFPERSLDESGAAGSDPGGAKRREGTEGTASAGESGATRRRLSPRPWSKPRA
jgi:integron integrase